MTEPMEWKNAQKWESGWWGNCANSLYEELKQWQYARKMGLDCYANSKSPYNILVDGKSVLDIGGGPVSILLKCVGFTRAKVVDPLTFPEWVYGRYDCAGIEHEIISGEQIKESGWDEVWIYNCLQHTYCPQLIIQNAQKAGKIIRIFEWIEAGGGEGHPQVLSRDRLDQWLGGRGKVEQMTGHARGLAYYGIFPT